MTVIDAALPIITFLALTAVGLDLTPADFHRMRRQKVTLTAGLVAPVFLLPILALGLLRVFEPAPHVAAGLLLVAACPIGGISNTYSYLARASTALSVTLTTLSAALAFVTIPAVSWGFERALGQPMGFAAPAMLPAQLLLMVMLPVVTGMWIRHRWPDVAEERRREIQRAAFIALALLLMLIIGSDVDQFTSSLSGTIPLAVAFIILSFGVGWLVATTLTAPLPDRFTLAAEFATRNVAIATAIAVTLLGQASFAFFGATYFLTELPLMLVATAMYRWRAPSAPVAASTGSEMGMRAID
jgi:BASS family bile acid:Na+ symporter